MLEEIITDFNEHINLSSRCIEPLAGPIENAVNQLCKSLLSQKNILCLGSMQSRHVAQQFCYYMQHQYKHERPALPCISLCDVDPNNLYDNLVSIGKKDDSLLFFQQAGCKLNVTDLITHCEEQGITPIICGDLNCAQNNFKNAANCISIPSENAISVLEIQQLIMHTFCALIDYKLFDLRG